MAERRVNVRLDGNSRGYVRSAKEAADATEDLRRKAERFAGRSYDAKAGVKGTAKAEEEIRRLEERLNRLQRTYTARVQMNTRGAQRDVALIMNSIAALGPAAVTAAAGASGALLAIGSTASTVAAGLGVLVLGLVGVGDAVEKMQKYQLDPTEENLDNLNDALKELSVTGQKFAKYLFSLKPILKELRGVAQEGLLPGLEVGLRELQGALPTITLLIDRMSKTLGDIGAKIGKTFDEPFWRGFFNFIGQEAAPTLEKLFSAAEKVARGVAAMQMAFNPMAQDFLTGLDQMASKFANWAQNLSQSSSFDGFIAYLKEIGPTLLDFVGSVGNMLAQLAKAMAPVGPVVIKILEGIADAIGAIASVPGVGTTLVTIATAMGALNLALRGMEVAKFSRLGQALGSLPSLTNKAALGAGVMTEKFTGSAAAGERVATAGSKVGTALGNVGKALPIIGVAAVGLAVGFDELADKSDDFAKNVISGSSSMQQAINDERNSIEKRNFWLGDTTDHLDNETEARRNLNQRMDEEIAKLSGESQARAIAQRALAEYNFQLDNFGFGSQQARDAANALRIANDELAIQQIMMAEGTDRATAALLHQRDVMTESANADIAAERAKIQFEQAQIRAAEASKRGGAASLEARDANLSLRESAIRSAEAAGLKAEADGRASGAADIGRLKAEAQGVEFRRLADLTKDPLRAELLRLADQTTKLPNGSFTITANGQVSLDQALKPIADLRSQLTNAFGLGGGNNAGLIGPPGMYTGRASGGVLPGYTPGKDVHFFQSPTAGTLGLSGGEAVMRPEWTRAMGTGYVNAANAAARRGGVQGVREFMGLTVPGQAPSKRRRADSGRFATGGVINSGLPLGSLVPIVHQVTSASLVAQLAPKVTEVLREAHTAYQNFAGGAGGGAALAWAGTQVGKPYQWGAVGPGSYDCSGFISALLNVADGKPIHVRRGTTASMPWPGFQPGLGPGINVGWMVGNPGHMAGTINGVNVESAGGVGVRVGGPVGATSSMFNRQAHYVTSGGGGVGGDVQRWAPMVAQALAMMGQPASLVQTVLRRMQQESGGNPQAVNRWDSNAQRGTPSKGLMQVIDPTYRAYADPRRNLGPFDPLSNLLASMRYAIARYGSLSAAYNRPGGYADGGRIPGPLTGRDDRFVLAAAGERVLTRAQNISFERLVDVLDQPRPVAVGAGGGPATVEKHFHLTVQNAGNSRVDLEAQFKRLEAMAGV